MFRLNDWQLHILLGIIAFFSVLLGCIFVWRNGTGHLVSGEFVTLNDISDGWVATYETTDENKLKQYKTTDNESKSGVITEVINLPNDFMVKEKKKITLTQKIPDITVDKLYLVFTTNGQNVRVGANGFKLYENDYSKGNYTHHVVTIPYQYKNGALAIEIESIKGNPIHFGEVKIGTFTELMGDAFVENGYFVLFGSFLIVVCLILLLIRSFIDLNLYTRNKQLLLYIGMEGIAAGIMFLLASRLLRVLINWEFICYYMQVCMSVIIAILHLLVIRCQIRKKRILNVVDFGILFFCIFYVSGIVFQWFSLLRLI